MVEGNHIGSVAMGDTSAPPCWWIDHGSIGQITQREDEATAAIDEGKKVVRYFSDRPVQEPVAQIEFARGTAGRENEMPRVVSCNWLPDGVYSVYAAPQPAHGTAATERVATALPDNRHEFFPNKKYPWFCAHCGYAPHEPLMHVQPSTTSEGSTDA